MSQWLMNQFGASLARASEAAPNRSRSPCFIAPPTGVEPVTFGLGNHTQKVQQQSATVNLA